MTGNDGGATVKSWWFAREMPEFSFQAFRKVAGLCAGGWPMLALWPAARYISRVFPTTVFGAGRVPRAAVDSGKNQGSGWP
jgi:hypothetical protein